MRTKLIDSVCVVFDTLSSIHIPVDNEKADFILRLVKMNTKLFLRHQMRASAARREAWRSQGQWQWPSPARVTRSV